ncbi:MAG: NAD(P)H-hydrate dehydratase [Chitinophagaceae bacterium]|nr:MAG: NAD(P)H-hydrate dehydratase [Chitinophagaceae bacterium]
MKIFSAEQTRAWDAYTIAHEPIVSIELMERAAAACTRWLLERFAGVHPFYIFCGNGNNGGDGLAIARQLIDYGRSASVFILDSGKSGSPDFLQNLQRLQTVTDRIELLDGNQLPHLPADAVVIDSLFGTGLNAPLQGPAAALAAYINANAQQVVSIDLPSGMLADEPSTGPIVSSDVTLTFGAPKLAQLLQENGVYVGQLVLLDIGLSPEYSTTTRSAFEYVDEARARSLFRPRNRFAHKGTYGHALLVAGAYGKMGAAVMAAQACLRGGSGLLSCHVPGCGYAIMQSTVPEAMLLPDNEDRLLRKLPPDIERYNAIGIGPGIGADAVTVELLSAYFTATRASFVVDADALNILSRNPHLLQRVPAGSILTPHPKEFDRLFGAHPSDFDRVATALREAARLHCVILLKGHHTFTATPGGTGFFNSTGNAGMAKGGSGDVLTGLLTALLAQGYSAEDAAVLGVWLHGRAADSAVQTESLESLLPTDIVAHFGAAFRRLY